MIQTVKFDVKFPDNHFWDSMFVFELEKSSAFQYGNGTCVIVNRTLNYNDSKCNPQMIDTRYEQGITKNFLDWCINYLKQNFVTHKVYK